MREPRDRDAPRELDELLALEQIFELRVDDLARMQDPRPRALELDYERDLRGSDQLDERARVDPQSAERTK